jgi:UDP-N-acetylmuramate dehydrogenase
MNIQENISLKDKNWFHTGGNANYYCEPATADDFKQALEFANSNGMPVFVLGEGANILIADEGFNGLVIHPVSNKVEFSDGLVSAEAGVKFQDLINFCLDKQIVGLEDFSGIPGTVGGSVYINIHYFDKLLSDFLVSAKVIDLYGELKDVDKDWFNFGYDQSKLISDKFYLLEAKFTVKAVNETDTAFAKGRRDEIIRHRQMKYPYKNTCGSFFRNFHENEINFEVNGKKIVNIAYYLDKLGVKGDLRVGNAVVSHKHANMIEALEGATSSDIISLARKMQELVRTNFNITPQAECQLIGFHESPLY